MPKKSWIAGEICETKKKLPKNSKKKRKKKSASKSDEKYCLNAVKLQNIWKENKHPINSAIYIKQLYEYTGYWYIFFRLSLLRHNFIVVIIVHKLQVHDANDGDVTVLTFWMYCCGQIVKGLKQRRLLTQHSGEINIV